jgi:ATP/maltotriose-dependent transcriptional regulator MalT
MMQTIRERARTRAATEFVGRADELARLMACLEPDAVALVVLLHGVAGVGKSALLNRFADEATAGGVSVVLLDCRVLEPTEQGFMHGLAESFGVTAANIDEIVRQLAYGDRRIVLALDGYEVFRLLDSWLRLTFVPRLPDNVRVVLCGREVPIAAWTSGTSVHGAVAQIRLGPLSRTDAHELMGRLGLPEAKATVLDRLAHGHPLAIRLAVSALAERSDAAIESMASAEAVDQLARTFLADIDDPITRAGLEAASVVRRMTRPLMGAMVPDVEASAGMERLGALPFVERHRDGLVVHEAVQSAIAADRRANDPARHRQLRRRAWHYLREDAREIGRSELWRATADMLYLVENPVVRGGVLPPRE